MSENADVNKDEKEKWEFEDYAFTITGIIVGLLLVGPELLFSLFDIRILGGSLGDIGEGFAAGMEYGLLRTGWSINELRALSPMLFLLTTTICFIYDAIVARKSGGYTGSIFTHTFESLFEDAIYMVITTIMVYSAVLAGVMYISWLAGPITWILFLVIFPIVRKKRDAYEEVEKPWFLLIILVVGIIVEIITRQWIAFPAAWLFICAVKLIQTIREGNHTIDSVFDILYYAFSVVLMSVGIVLNFWIASWTAFPVALFICWILSKFKRFKKVKEG